LTTGPPPLAPPPLAPGEARPFGDAAVLVGAAGPDRARALAAVARDAELPGVTDVVGGLASVVVRVDPLLADPEELAGVLSSLEPAAHAAVEPHTVTVPVAFDGTDLAVVAEAVGLTPRRVVELLLGAELVVAVVGFSPGFAYLEGLPEPLRRVARREVPRPVVPAGSLALAGGFAAFYPQATPGGWQLVGRTALSMFDPDRPPYARLAPGNRVRLEEVPAPLAEPAAARRGPPLRRPWRRPGRAVVVEAPGLLTTVQDRGRPGLAHLGVPGAGPADPVAHRLGNLLVGNDADAATLEVNGLGPSLRFHRPAHLAVTGGQPPVRLDDLLVPCDRVVPVAAGQCLVVGATTTGGRAYVAVAGGFVVPRVLGSCATDTLAWIGPGSLVVGDELGVGPAAHPLGDHLADGDAGPRGTDRVLRVVPGPHAGWFAADLLDDLAARRFTVEASSDRIGVNLVADDGAPLERVPGELLSQGMVHGAVQVPPAGKPVVLLVDHATLGGYPVAAVVVSADVGVLGQCRGGDAVVFEPVTSEEARRARQRLEQRVATAVVGHYPVVPG